MATSVSAEQLLLAFLGAVAREQPGFMASDKLVLDHLTNQSGLPVHYSLWPLNPTYGDCPVLQRLLDSYRASDLLMIVGTGLRDWYVTPTLARQGQVAYAALEAADQVVTDRLVVGFLPQITRTVAVTPARDLLLDIFLRASLYRCQRSVVAGGLWTIARSISRERILHPETLLGHCLPDITPLALANAVTASLTILTAQDEIGWTDSDLVISPYLLNTGGRAAFTSLFQVTDRQAVDRIANTLASG